MNIPFYKLYYDNRESDAVHRAMRRNMIGVGPVVSSFEKDFARYVGSSFAVSVNSCSSALHLAVEGLGIGPGDEVITTPLTFSSTLLAILYTGATPILADIDSVTYCISSASIRTKITKRTKAILAVHYAGNSCNMDELVAICKEYGLALVEDAAHALPTRWKGHLIGEDRKEIKNVICYSFQATKTLAIGDGGMLVTWDEELAEVFRMKRMFGMKRHDDTREEIDVTLQYRVEMMGYKYNMTDIEASIGKVQLKKLQEMHILRKNVAQRYIDGLKDLNNVVIPKEQENQESSWHLFVIRLQEDGKRDALRKYLSKCGIVTSIHFIPLYYSPYFHKILGNPFDATSNIETIADQILSLPMYPAMTEEETSYVITSIHQFII